MGIAVFLFHWLQTMKGALPPDQISPQQFPKLFAWISRFDSAIKAAAQKAGKPKRISGEEALKLVQGMEFMEKEAAVEENDPLGLKKGDVVEVWPVDTGFNHKDRGPLLGLDGREVVVEGKTEEATTVRVHAPRHGFRVRHVESKL